MSIASNTLIGFSSLGAISLSSFLLVNSNKKETVLIPTSVQIEAQGEGPEAKPIKPPSISQILKEAGYEGCEYLAGQGWRKTLFVCWKKIRENEFRPSFFRYDRNQVNSDKNAKADHIVGITYQSSKLAKMRFKDGRSYDLTPPPAWMSKLRDKVDFDPESICYLQKSLSSSSYELNCNGRGVQKGINI